MKELQLEVFKVIEENDIGRSSEGIKEITLVEFEYEHKVITDFNRLLEDKTYLKESVPKHIWENRLVENRRWHESNMKFDVGGFEKIERIAAEIEEILKKQYNALMGIYPFQLRKRLWMQRYCKHYTHKGKGYLGITATNWFKIGFAKKRR
jgi:hypothetical protein